MMSGASGRWTALLMLPAVVFLVGVGWESDRALSQASEDQIIAAQAAYVPGQIFVKFKDEAPADAEDRLEDATGAREEEEFSFIDVSLVDLPEGLSVPEAVKQYESSPYVEYAEPNPLAYPDQATPDSYEADPGDFVEPAPVEPVPADPAPDPIIEPLAQEMSPVVPDDPEYPTLWGFSNSGQVVDPDASDGQPGTAGTPDADIDASEAWGVTAGGPETVVAIVDTGVDISHPDLSNNAWVNADEVPGNGTDDDSNGYADDVKGWDFAHGDNTVYDEEGEVYHHGTHIAGTVAAEGDNGEGVAGVAWRTKIMPLKFMAPGGGTAAQAVEALQYAVNNGATISNHSYKFDTYNQTFEEALQWANDRGHLVVASAGNRALDTDATPQYPAGYDSPNVVSVAATDHNDAPWVRSNRGATSVDLSAPGAGILSTMPGGGYSLKEGTSMAAAQVSGVAALLKSDRPGLTPEQIKSHILLGADKQARLVGTSVTGGRLNAADALGIVETGISLQTSSPQIVYGGSALLSGKLISNGQGLAGKQVVLEKRWGEDTRFFPFATVTTAMDGSFSYNGSRPTELTDYRARFGGEDATNLGASVSGPTRTEVKVAIGMSVATGDFRIGTSRARGISGYVGPNHAGNSVTLTIKRNGAFFAERPVTLNADSRYSTTFKPRNTGNYAMSVSFAGDADHLGNATPFKGFRAVR